MMTLFAIAEVVAGPAQTGPGKRQVGPFQL